MPRTAYAVRHVAFEDLGIFEDLLTERGFTVKYRDAGIDALNTPEVREADLLVILGAPISVNETQDYPFLFEEVELIKARIAEQKPVLGICLGAQQIAPQLQEPRLTPPVPLSWATPRQNLPKSGKNLFSRR